jgi:hypothetical protein
VGLRALTGQSYCGALFDIDALGGNFYGQAAYEWLFKAVGVSRRAVLAGCLMLDGDTNATLSGSARLYCIATASEDSERIARIRECVRKKHVGLLGIPYEGGTLEAEPLVLAVRFGAGGGISWCETPWIVSAWKTVFEQ